MQKTRVIHVYVLIAPKTKLAKFKKMSFLFTRCNCVKLVSRASHPLADQFYRNKKYTSCIYLVKLHWYNYYCSNNQHLIICTALSYTGLPSNTTQPNDVLLISHYHLHTFSTNTLGEFCTYLIKENLNDQLQYSHTQSTYYVLIP